MAPSRSWFGSLGKRHSDLGREGVPPMTSNSWSLNAERLRLDDFVKYRYHIPAKLDYGLPFARNVGCL